MMSAAANNTVKRWRPRRFRITDKALVPCHESWLPEEDAHLAVELECANVNAPTTGTKKRVWFPEDSAGEPHPKNPDDGCGGAKYKLTTKHEVEKVDLKASDHNETANLMRQAQDRLRERSNSLFRLSNWNDSTNLFTADKIKIWTDFQQATDQLKEPDYCLIGYMWRSLFFAQPRFEESTF